MRQTEFFLLFNEQDAACAAHLDGLVTEFREARKPWPPNVMIGITNATFIELTTEMTDHVDSSNGSLVPTFAFVDPVGVKATPMSVLQRLTGYPKGELLVYFAHEFVTRFCGAGNVDQALTDLFGTEEYKDASLLPRRRSVANTCTICTSGSCMTSASSRTSRASPCTTTAESGCMTCSTAPVSRSAWTA